MKKMLEAVKTAYCDEVMENWKTLSVNPTYDYQKLDMNHPAYSTKGLYRDRPLFLCPIFPPTQSALCRTCWKRGYMVTLLLSCL